MKNVRNNAPRFKVVFEMQNDYGEWFPDWLDNNGHGYNHDDAEGLRAQVYDTSLGLVRNVKVERMEAAR